MVVEDNIKGKGRASYRQGGLSFGDGYKLGCPDHPIYSMDPHAEFGFDQPILNGNQGDPGYSDPPPRTNGGVGPTKMFFGDGVRYHWPKDAQKGSGIFAGKRKERKARLRDRVECGFSGQRKRILLSTARPFADTVVPILAGISGVELRLICEESTEWYNETYKIPCYLDEPTCEKRSIARARMDIEAAKLIEWSDLVIVAPMDAGTLGSIASGLTSTLTLKVLRGWDITRPMMFVPAMSTMEWENPVTGNHLEKLGGQWPWVDIFPPLLSRFQAPDTMVQIPWEGLDSFAEAIWEKVDHDTECVSQRATVYSNGTGSNGAAEQRSTPKDNQSPDQKEQQGQKDKADKIPKKFPLEILLIIFEYLGDWEVAKAVGIHLSHIPMPEQWVEHLQHTSRPESLEYNILTGSFEAVKERLFSLPRWKPLSNLASHLIFKFSRTDILTYLSENHMDLFWTTSHLTQLPLRASAIYDNRTILTWWRDCPALPTKDYHPDAVDGASRAGFVDILEWWRTSGLPLLYTERSLESASAEGNIAVLEWWKNASANAPLSDPIHLRPGKSILLAAQSGRTSSLAWWDASGIPYTHSDSVTRIASTHGHVPVLELWHRLKDQKLIFDNQVLVGATKNGHVDVLEWWRQSGLRVEFKTCDIEEALEDAVSGREDRVRQWWDRNGLNLGVGTSEWMKVKVL